MPNGQTSLSPKLIELLRNLSEAVGISGDEGAVRKIVLAAIQGTVDHVAVDSMGNILATRKGRGHSRVMAAAHMDEVGIMIVAIDKDGLLRFAPVGGLAPHMLLGKPMWVGPEKLPGVIGAAPVHLLNYRERRTVPEMAGLRIDIGLTSGEGAGNKVKPGDRATFATSFADLDPSLRGKAFDDRVGVAVLIELLRSGQFPFQFTAAFTVQEEIGLRGAQVAAYTIKPDAALAVEATPAHDLPLFRQEDENVRYNTRLDHGPAISLADASALHDRRLIQHFTEVAESHGIPYQFRQPGGGGTDAGAIQRSRASVPTVTISVPTRYIHSPAALIRVNDLANTIRLARLGLETLTPKVYRRK